MKLIPFLVGLLFLVPLQSTVLEHFTLFHVKPDLALIVVALVGASLGKKEGVMLGIVSGLIVDTFSGEKMGLHLFTKLCVGYLCGEGRRVFLDISPPGMGTILLCLSLIQGFLFSLFTGYGITDAFWAIILPQGIYDGLFGALLWWGVSSRVFRREAPEIWT